MRHSNSLFQRGWRAIGMLTVLLGAVAIGGCTLFLAFAPSPAEVVGANAFIDISDRLGAEREIMGWGGLAAFDYDGDGDIDLLVMNGPGMPNRLFQNDGQANFTEVAEQAGLAMAEENCAVCTVGDLNNDGRLDVILGRQGMMRPEGSAVSILLMLNNGPNGQGVVTFTEATSAQTGLTSEEATMAVGVGDLDNNGFLDVLVGTYDMREADGFAPWQPTQVNELWKCTGVIGGIPQYALVAGAGIEGTPYPGQTPETADQLSVPGTLVFYITDVDGDGFMDFFDLHDIPGGIDLFHNNGDMTFTRAQMDLLNKSGGWMGMAGSDYDGDGDMDYFTTNLGSDSLFPPFNPPVIASTPLLPTGTPFHMLLRNDGGTLSDVSASTSVAPSSVLPPLNRWQQNGLKAFEFGFGTTWIDADNRGWHDLYWFGDIKIQDIAPGVRLDYHGVGRFLENQGDGSFADMTAQRALFDIRPENKVAAGQNDFGRCVAACDLNGDGYRDLITTHATMLGGTPANLRVLLNPALAGNHWLTVRLRGFASNRDGLGAMVKVMVNGRTLVEEVVSTTGAFTGVQPEAHFGLGSASAVDSLEIHWPSGGVTKLNNTAADQILTVPEDQ